MTCAWTCSPRQAEGRCDEWKGPAAYFDLAVGACRVARAAWHYPSPTAPFVRLREHLAFYPGRVDGCFLDDERAAAQPGELYGGWVTADIQGPFKGEPGTLHW